MLSKAWISSCSTPLGAARLEATSLFGVPPLLRDTSAKAHICSFDGAVISRRGNSARRGTRLSRTESGPRAW